MVNPQGTSFIPQRPAHGKTALRKVRKIYVLAYLSYVLFFGALIASAGIFFMNFSLNAQLESQQQRLTAEKELFNDADIESIRDLEKRMGIAEERLNNHVSVLAIFEALEASAVSSLEFESFSYEREGDEFPTVAFGGSANEFNSVLFQREVLSSNPILAGSDFKEIGVETRKLESGDTFQTVRFALEKKIDTGLIGYTPRNMGVQNENDDMQQEGNDQFQEQSVGDEMFDNTEEVSDSFSSEVEQ